MNVKRSARKRHTLIRERRQRHPRSPMLHPKQPLRRLLAPTRHRMINSSDTFDAHPPASRHNLHSHRFDDFWRRRVIKPSHKSGAPRPQGGSTAFRRLAALSGPRSILARLDPGQINGRTKPGECFDGRNERRGPQRRGEAFVIAGGQQLPPALRCPNSQRDFTGTWSIWPFNHGDFTDTSSLAGIAAGRE